LLVPDTIQPLLPDRDMTADLIRVMTRGTRLALHHHKTMDMDVEDHLQDLMGDRQ
jgi:hypothetical protein